MDALRKVLKDPEEVIIRTYGLPPDIQRAILTKVIDGVSFSI